jgi:hypothetical protein
MCSISKSTITHKTVTQIITFNNSVIIQKKCSCDILSAFPETFYRMIHNEMKTPLLTLSNRIYRKSFKIHTFEVSNSSDIRLDKNMLLFINCISCSNSCYSRTMLG